MLNKIVNLSLETGHFANDWKCALVPLLLKKYNLNAETALIKVKNDLLMNMDYFNVNI